MMNERDTGSNLEVITDKAQHLRYALKRAIENNPADALLLSGGIDSSLLAALDPSTPAITVVIKERGIDLRHAQIVTEYLSTPWYPVEIDQEQAIDDVNEIIRLTGSYDPAIVNDVPIFEGLKQAAYLSGRTVRAGGAADELFAGYTYLHSEILDIQHYVKNLIPQIRLSTTPLARAMGLRLTYPYLYGEVLEIAESLERSKVIAIREAGPGDYAQRFDPARRESKEWGKIVLRQAAYGLLPEEIIWRIKTDLEFGSGADILENLIESSVTSEEIDKMEQSGKHFWNRYHGKLYLMYQELGFEPKKPTQQEYSCTWCEGGELIGRTHCHTCGAHPANEHVVGTFQKQ